MFRVAVDRRGLHRGAAFTLVELLVSISIIALLISLLLPAMQRARDSASTLRCAANLRSIGQGLIGYAADNNGYLPTAWSFQGTTVNATTQIQTPTVAVYGYVHWSSFILGAVGQDAFTCPTLTLGGFPACDPIPGNFDNGQTIDTSDNGSMPIPSGVPGYGTAAVTGVDGNGVSQTYYPDQQSKRCAYSLNEGLCGTSVWCIGFQPGSAPNAAVRVTRLITIGQVTNASGTILATEFVNEWGIVSGVNRATPPSKCKSYRAIEPWRSEQNISNYDPSDLPYLPTSANLRHTNSGDLWQIQNGSNGATQSLDIVADYQAGNYSYLGTGQTRLDFVGRNHGYGVTASDRKTNFVYCDGHVETKSILQTIPKVTDLPGAAGNVWEWGAQPYSIAPAVLSTAYP